METLVKPLRLFRDGRTSELWLVSLEGLGKAAIEKRFRRDFVGDPAALFSALRTAAEARDEALIRTFDIDLTENMVRVWMEHVPGESVSAVQARARREGAAIPLEISARIVADAARGLHRAHEHGRVSGREPMFVHGAMSSRSVLLGFGGEVKVLELGAGSVVLRAADSIGLQLHIAPELAQGRSFDRRADVFALGVMMRELSAGVRLPPALSSTIERAISRFPETRFSTAEDLAEAIRDAVGELADRTMIAKWLHALIGETDTQPNRSQVDPSLPPASETAIGALHGVTGEITAIDPRVAAAQSEESKNEDLRREDSRNEDMRSEDSRNEDMRSEDSRNEELRTASSREDVSLVVPRDDSRDDSRDDDSREDESTTTAKRPAVHVRKIVESVDSTDPSKAGIPVDPGTSTQDRVDIEHTVSREVSGSSAKAYKGKGARAERRGRLRKRRPRRALTWALAAACVPLVALLLWIVRAKFTTEGAVRPAVAIDAGEFGSERRFDRAIPLSPRIEDVPLQWGRAAIPASFASTKTTRPGRVRPRRELREVREQPVVVEKPEAVIERPPVRTTGRVNVSVVRGGRSSRMLVFVDGKPLLRSPSAIDLSPGTHVLEIRPKGKPAIRKSVDVRAGVDVGVSLDAGDEDVDENF